MEHEDSLPNLAERQRYAAGAHAAAGEWTDIGEAEVTQTIFGKARVHIIHHEKKHRAKWLLAMGGTAGLAAAWVGWLMPQPPAQTQSMDIPLSLGAAVTAPLPRAIPQASTRSPDTPQQPQTLPSAAPVAAKPVAPKPLPAAPSRTALPAANNNAMLNKPAAPIPGKQSSPIRPQPAPITNSPAMHNAAKSPASAVAPSAPLAQESASPGKTP